MYKIQEELKEWAEETYNFYLPLASKLNMDFYTQSKLTDITDDKPVELMVIGINPGHGGTFLKDRFEKSEDLLLGNTYKGKHETIQKWRILTNLRSILDFAGLGSMLDNESQLIDPVLTEVMDTTLRIKISDVLYKVTQYGTFSVNQENEKYLQAVIDKFDTTLVHTVEPGQTINLSNGVSFTNSFGGNSVQDEECELVPLEPKTRATQSETDYNLQAGYNTQDYVWKNHSVWQKIWDKVRGKDVSREANFDKKHRVQVEVFDVNYRFYVSSGIKVKMQRRKKFCFVKYWVGDTAEKIAVGFNCITGELKWDNPASYSSIAPAPSSAWGTFQSTINNQLNSFIYSAVSSWHSNNSPWIKSIVRS